MQFNSYLFLMVFLPAVLAGYFGLCAAKKGTWAKLFLTGASLLFFAWGNPWYLILLLGSAVVNWIFSCLLQKKKSRGVLAAGIAANVLVLFYYKYFHFFLDNLNVLLSQDIFFKDILLPVGISFFTFQQIAWLVDTYRGETRGYSFWDYLLFTVYFPKIAMGPIILHWEFMPQLQDESRLRPDSEKLARGLMLLAAGLFKKVILAECFGAPVGWGFSALEGLSAADAFLVMLAYTFQLYFDFSGYCDMAMGVSLMLGLELPQNFDSPYKALSPVEFWKGWHMTLTRFLRTYIYFPLGGSRKGSVRTYVNIMVIFLVSGIWHGANWTFILWGFLHGLAQCLTRAFGKQWDRLHVAFQWMVTFGFVNLTWVIFRADSISQAVSFLKKLGRFEHMQISPGFIESFQLVELPSFFRNHRVTTVMLLYVIALYIVMNTENLSKKQFRPTVMSALGTALMLVWSVLSLSGIATFIYFQF